MENEKVNTDALIPKDEIDRRAHVMEMDKVKAVMRGDMELPTKIEAEELLKPFGVSIIGDDYGWNYSETAIKLHNGEIVFRAPEGVFHLYSARMALRNVRVKALHATGYKDDAPVKSYCSHGSPIFLDDTTNSHFCRFCNPETIVPRKSLPTI